MTLAIPNTYGAPTITSVACVAPLTLVVQWIPPTNVGAGPIILYQVYRTTNSAFLGTNIANFGPAQTYMIDDGVDNGGSPLDAATTYYYTVNAVNSAGSGPFSNRLGALPVTPANDLVDESNNGIIDDTFDALVYA
jgi:hypothetical protein